MLTAQFFVLVLLAWKLLAPAAAVAENDEKEKKKEPTVAEQIDELERTLTRRFDDQERSRAVHDAQERLLKNVTDAIRGDQGKIVDEYETQEVELNRLTSDLEGQKALVRELKSDREKLTNSLATEKREHKSDSDKLELETTANEDLRKEKKDLAAENADYKEQIKTLQGQVSGELPAPGTFMFWIYISLAVVGGAALGAVAVVVAARRPLDEQEVPFEADAAEAAADDGRPSATGDDSASPNSDPEVPERPPSDHAE
jgi:hypothetical protein